MRHACQMRAYSSCSLILFAAPFLLTWIARFDSIGTIQEGFTLKQGRDNMNLQKNLLWIPVVFGFVWGLFDLFAPETVLGFLNIPSENINPSLVSTVMILAICQLSLGIIALWMRSLKDKAAISGAMTVVAVAFLLFGLEAILVDFVVEGLARNMILVIQGIVFIILAVLFFLYRKPKTDEE